MSDTTITAEERARLRSVLSEHGTPQVEDRIILRLLNTIEQAEARALRWTHEPPKVAGWYWCSDNDDSNGYPLISHYDEWAIKEFLPKINDGKTRFKWAGPIAPPID